MKKKNKKIIIISSLSVIVLLLLAFLGVFNYLFSVIGITNNGILLPVETGNFNFAGEQGNYETVKLGCYDGSGIYQVNVVEAISFCNSLDSSNTLKLSSSLSMESCSPTKNGGSTCVRTNYIQSKIVLPAGKYSINYNYLMSDIRNGKGEVVSFTIDDFSDSENITNPTGSKTYEFTLTSPKEITFRIDTTVRSNWDKGSGGSAEGTMIISFTPQIPETQCSDGEEKCIGYDSYNCVNSQWSSAGKVVGKCDVGCLSNSDCIPSEGYSCSGNALMKNVTTGSCVSYKCSGSEPVVEKMCTFSCDSKKNLCFENTSKFKIILISSIVGIILIVVLIIFLVKKRR